LESFWEGKSSAADLEAVAKDLRASADGICWFPVTPSHTMIRSWTPQSLLELCPPFMARLGVVTLGLMATSLWPMVMPLTLLWKWPNGLTPTSKSCTLWSINWCAFSNKFFFKLRDLFSSHCYSWWTWQSDTLWVTLIHLWLHSFFLVFVLPSNCLCGVWTLQSLNARIL
jgi:hypothetical protein